MLVTNNDFELLTANFVRLGPILVILTKIKQHTEISQLEQYLQEDFGVIYDSFQFIEDELIYVDLLANQILCLILRVVGVAQPSVLLELELEEFVPKLALVADVVS